MPLTPEVKAIIARAADWLEANPAKHISGYMAADGNGTACNALDPKAECFCALGRIAFEGRVRSRGMIGCDNIHLVLKIDAASVHRIWKTNDKVVLIDQDNPKHRGRAANPAVITLMRELAA